MKITENADGRHDFAGRCPICSVKGAELAKIAQWLWDQDPDHAFCIVFRASDEYPVPEKPSDYVADVLYLDELFDEVVYYIGLKDAREWLDRLEKRSGKS